MMYQKTMLYHRTKQYMLHYRIPLTHLTLYRTIFILWSSYSFAKFHTFPGLPNFRIEPPEKRGCLMLIACPVSLHYKYFVCCETQWKHGICDEHLNSQGLSGFAFYQLGLFLFQLLCSISLKDLRWFFAGTRAHESLDLPCEELFKGYKLSWRGQITLLQHVKMSYNCSIPNKFRLISYKNRCWNMRAIACPVSLHYFVCCETWCKNGICDENLNSQGLSGFAFYQLGLFLFQLLCSISLKDLKWFFAGTRAHESLDLPCEELFKGYKLSWRGQITLLQHVKMSYNCSIPNKFRLISYKNRCWNMRAIACPVSLHYFVCCETWCKNGICDENLNSQGLSGFAFYQLGLFLFQLLCSISLKDLKWFFAGTRAHESLDLPCEELFKGYKLSWRGQITLLQHVKMSYNCSIPNKFRLISYKNRCWNMRAIACPVSLHYFVCCETWCKNGLCDEHLNSQDLSLVAVC